MVLKFSVRWVPYTSNSELRHKRVEFPEQLFRALEPSQRAGFRDIVAGDKSCFCNTLIIGKHGIHRLAGSQKIGAYYNGPENHGHGIPKHPWRNHH
jgi:hypothetical protein